MNNYEAIMNAVEAGQTLVAEDVKAYASSYTKLDGVALLMIKDGHTKLILAQGDGALADELQGRREGSVKVCPLSHDNRLILNRYLPYTAPKAFGTQIATIGLGDRLGIASPGHIATVRGKDVRPILAQQSIRELNLTGRTYEEVLDAAAYAVFQEGYKDGYGADGDHLKNEADIRYALGLGFTMLTLDCSEKIDNSIEAMTAAGQEDKYANLPENTRLHFESRYLNRTFEIDGGITVSFDRLR